MQYVVNVQFDELLDEQIRQLYIYRMGSPELFQAEQVFARDKYAFCPCLLLPTDGLTIVLYLLKTFNSHRHQQKPRLTHRPGFRTCLYLQTSELFFLVGSVKSIRQTVLTMTLFFFLDVFETSNFTSLVL